MSTEMTPKEAFQRIESVIELADDSVNTNTATGRELEEAIIRINDNIKLVRQALTELGELKRDVKRFMELKNNLTNREEMDEFWEIDNKLKKIGNEE